MRKLLSTLIGVLFVVSSAYAAKGIATAYAYAKGQGLVYVSTKKETDIDKITEWVLSDYDTHEVLGNLISKKTAYVYSYAKANVAYTFMGWSVNGDDENTESSSNPYTTQIESGRLSDASKIDYLYAIFKPVIECTTTSFNIIKQGTTGSNTFEARLRNPGTPSISITKNGEATDHLTCGISKVDGQTASSVAASGNFLVEYKVTALADAFGEYLITINAANGAQHIVKVTVLSNVTITFFAPENGQYTYTRNNGDGTAKTMTPESENSEVVMTETNQFSYTLSASASAGYRFNKWTFKNSDDVYLNPYTTYVATDGDEIVAEFIHDSYAMFKVKGKDDVYYSDLNEAIDAVGGAGTIVVHKSGIMAPGNYEIPEGVILLVPGDDAETARTDATTKDDFDTPPSTRVCKKYLELSDNTMITVKNGGAISVYAKMSHSQPTNGMPYSFGRIDMGNNCHIVVESGAVLSALGYITGDPNTSSVTINSGAVVYEAFQIRDWRGGSAVMEVAGSSATDVATTVLLGNDVTINSSDKKVFPIGQYYLQTIETKLIIESGAQEIMTTAAEMGLGSLGDAVEMVANAPFVVPDNNNFSSGLFRLGSGVQLIKSYDKNSDRQVYEIRGSGISTNARFGHISLVFPVEVTAGTFGFEVTKIANVTVSSEGYVLPISNNLDVTLDNVTVSMTYDMNLLGDASVTINNNAVLEIAQNARFFISDKEESKSMWYGASTIGNATIVPLAYTPNNSQYLLDASGKLISSTDATVVKDANLNTTSAGNLYKRQVNDILAYDNDIAMKDARLEVNGQLIVKGRLYTTKSGADITSSGAGTVEFKQVDHSSGDKLYRYLQLAEGDLAIGFHAIPVTNAKLHNDEEKNSSEPYAAINAEAGAKYTYVQSLGKWLLPQELRIEKHTGEQFALTLPEDKVQNIVCAVQTESNTISEANFEVVYPSDGLFTKADEPIYDVEAKTLTIPIKYACQNKHSLDAYTKTLIVKCKNLTNDAILHTEEIKLKATEDYRPKFTVSINGTNYTNGAELPIIGTGVDESISLPIVITAEQDNVANNFVTWLSQDKVCEAPFSFEYGEKTETPFGNAKLTYLPESAGLHEGKLMLSASYTDDNGMVLEHTISITLKAKVELKHNTLAFAIFPERIYINADPFELINVATKNVDSEIDISLSEEGIVNISGSGKTEDPYMVNPVGLGSVTITAVQKANRIYQGKTIKINIMVISSEILSVGLCINSKDNFNKTLYGGSSVTYNVANNTIDFNSTSAISEWIFRFEGTPDKLTFTPVGDNTWSIQQRSSDDEEWESLETWATLASNESKTWQLKHTTSQIRIQYGTSTTTQDIGTLKDFCVSELLISANVNKVYLPIYVGEVSEKIIVLTHTKNNVPAITLTGGLSYTTEISENLGTESAPYYRTTVTIKTTANTEEKTYQFAATEDGHTVAVLVNAYNFPQELPIKLATDAPTNGDRYHYVATASSYAQWDATNRQIVFQNPGAQLTRSVTFAFNGAPSIISLEAYSVDGAEVIDDLVWEIEESKTGAPGSFEPATLPRDSVATNRLVQELNYTTRYVRVSYNSTSTREIRLSNIVIEGYPDVIVEPQNVMLTSSSVEQQVYAIAINLQNVNFVVDNAEAFQITTDTTYQTSWASEIHATSATHSSALGVNKVDTIFLGVKWMQLNALDEGELKIYNASNDSLMVVVPLLGADNYLVKGTMTGIYTGIPDGSVDAEENYTFHNNVYEDYPYHQVDLINAYDDNGIALFDYLFIYGETTPSEGTDIIAPQQGSADGSTNIGSNAVTPLYVYKKEQNTDGEYKGYKFVSKVQSVNTKNKTLVEDIIVADANGVVFIDATTPLRIYMTGFCPYATTGYDKLQEGVFLFRGNHGSKLDIYLENLHVFSRNKTENGNGFYGKEGGETFSDGYARGSGGVLVFENVDPQEQLQDYQPFDVSIHTMGDNLLKSNYGCFFALNILDQTAMKATQVSSPIQIHMASSGYERKTKTNLNFDDIWPTALNEDNIIIDTKRTNGYLGLKKQANNAPSIDIGNKHTVVNFNGGQIELQNSQIGSDTYKTTLAISHRSGYFGSDDAGIQLCYGIGTDSVGGTVNFLDGTVIVEKMYVKPAYRQYYLMDTLANGDDSEYTTCLRTPKNTYIKGGSVCRVRACQHVTSKGGAPKDYANGSFLGQYVYTMQGDDRLDANTKLAHIEEFPDNIEGLKLYHQNNGYTYGLNSVTPNENGQFYFWIPNGMGGVEAEVDKYMSIWKACMTEIGAGIPNVAEGRVGGDTPIEVDEEVKYFMYCQIDENIRDVISAGEEVGDVKNYTYEPPFEVPSAAKQFFGGKSYVRYDLLNYVSDSLQYQVTSDTAYTITDKVYYVTTAIADIWQTFTAPFDVENIYVVETYSENELSNFGTNRSDKLEEQARHNADFAAFFAVAMAMGTDKDFDGIYNSYINWARSEDKEVENVNYNKRGMYELIPYVVDTIDNKVIGNWATANFYLNHNDGDWILNNDKDFGFETKWRTLSSADTTDGILLHKGETYSMLFPYCVGCEEFLEDRDYWDYWSGKFLIFESTEGPQVINGRDFLNDTIDGNIFSEEMDEYRVKVTGNSTFAFLETEAENVYKYQISDEYFGEEGFTNDEDEIEQPIIYPTTAFLYGYVPTNRQGMPARKISRTGEIIYPTGDNNGNDTPTGGHTPTVGGGSDIFVTSVAEGINIAVSEPQYVGVFSANGALLYNGWVETAVNVNLVSNGVYVVVGENNSVKVVY